VDGQRLENRSVDLGFCLAGYDITEKDEIEFEGVRYRITGEPINPAYKGHHLEIPMERVR
jgi:hypothetical protein